MWKGNTNISEEFLDSLLGLSLDNAITKCDANNYTTRIVKKDNESFVVTMDMSFNRINLEIATAMKESKSKSSVDIDEVVVRATIG
jgi:hypothetical protein